jgi:hypothetical protein
MGGNLNRVKDVFLDWGDCIFDLFGPDETMKTV